MVKLLFQKIMTSHQGQLAVLSRNTPEATKHNVLVHKARGHTAYFTKVTKCNNAFQRWCTTGCVGVAVLKLNSNPVGIIGIP